PRPHCNGAIPRRRSRSPARAFGLGNRRHAARLCPHPEPADRHPIARRQTQETDMANKMYDSMRDSSEVATDETQRLIASDKVEGTAVYNPDGENIGSVFNFMVDKYSGK